MKILLLLMFLIPVKSENYETQLRKIVDQTNDLEELKKMKKEIHDDITRYRKIVDESFVIRNIIIKQCIWGGE